MQKNMQSAIKVLGTYYNLLTREEVARAILQDALGRKNAYVCISNVHTTMMGLFDPAYQATLNSSTYTVPDGVPIVWAMNFLGAKEYYQSYKQDRVRGPSLMKEICAKGRKHGLRHYLYGAKEKTLEALKKYLEKNYEGIEIVGYESPPFRPLTKEEMRAAADRINQSKAHVVWVGLGAPKQEKWMYEQYLEINSVLIGVGAAFDLLPGIVPEAPASMQKLGLEWLFRFYQEPRRLWRRYVFNNPLFLLFLTLQVLSYRLFRKSYLCESKRQ